MLEMVVMTSAYMIRQNFEANACPAATQDREGLRGETTQAEKACEEGV
jgi:hypothetical protein